MLTREQPRTPAFLPAPLPSLSDALARRAAVFGPFDLIETPVIARGARQAVGRATRRVADLLDAIGR